MTTLTAFLNSIINDTDKYYSFIGSPSPNYLPTDIHDDVLFLKKITTKDIQKSVKRYDWVHGDVFYPYTKSEYDAGTLNGLPFYCMVYANGVYKVFKCLDNANGSPSTVSPATINRYGTVRLDDGYTWVYMYQIPINDYKKFATLDYIPLIQTNETINNLSPNTVDAIQVKNGGYGYTYCNATITGDGSGATAIVEVVDKKVTKVIVTSAGTGYTYANVMLLGDGAGASAVAVIPPTGGHSSNSEAELYCNALMVSSSISEKQDYKLLPYGSTYRKYGILKNITYNNNIGDMYLDYITVTNSGTGYTPDRKPTVNITGGFDAAQVTAGTAVAATAYASLSSDGITSVVLKTTGKNYRSNPNVSFTSSVGSGAAATAVMKASTIRNFYSLNVNSQSGKFKNDETIKQGSSTAKVLFHDVENSIIGIYNISGSFIANTLVEGLSSGAYATTNSINHLNIPEATFSNSNIFVSYLNSVITRQEDQPEKINIALLF